MKIINLVLCLIFYSCGTQSDNSKPIVSLKENEFEKISISFEDYELQLITDLIEDSLSGDWTDEIYGSPIVIRQNLHFFKGGGEVQKVTGPAETTAKTTSNHGIVEVKNIILFDLCLIGSKNTPLFEVSGSGFCHGISCPEYYGIFSLEGDILCEQISTYGPTGRGQYESCSEMLDMLLVQMNNTNECKSIIELWRK